MRPHDGGAVEEFVLDDRDLLRLCELPLPRKAQSSRRPHLRTVSIIDTLSALAQGAADKDDPPREPWARTPQQPPCERRPGPTNNSGWRRSQSRRQNAAVTEQDWWRQCVSDSEVKGSGDACSVLSLRSQPPRPSVMQRAAPPVASSTTLPRPARVPDWIRSIFRLAKKGDLEAMVGLQFSQLLVCSSGIPE